MHGRVITLYQFFKMAANSHVGFYVAILDHWPPTKCNCGSTNVGLIGCIVTEVLSLQQKVFGVLALPFHVVISAAHAQKHRYIYFRVRNIADNWICEDRLAYSTSNFQRRISSNNWFLLTKSFVSRFLAEILSRQTSPRTYWFGENWS